MKWARVLLLLTGLAALALGSAGCSFLLGDPYGDYLQKADRWLDLRAAILANSSLELNSLSAIHFAEGTAAGTPYRYLFIQGDFSDGSSRIGALGYDSMNLLNFETMPQPGALTADADLNGDIKIESDRFYADSLAPHLPGGLPIGGDGTWKWLIADSGTGHNYMFHINGSGLFHRHQYNAAWGAPSSDGWTIRGAESWDLARIEKLDDGRIVVLFSQGGGDYNIVIAAAFPDFATFDLFFGVGNLLECASASVGAQIDCYTPYGSYDSPAGIGAWITKDGIVSISTNKQNNRLTLTRYPLGPGGSLDSYSLTSRHEELLYFEPSGKYWYRFDRGSGRLFRLRTWW